MLWSASGPVAASQGRSTARPPAASPLDYLLPRAARFYGEVIGRGEQSEHARWVAGYILSRDVEEITAREIGRAYRDLREQPDEIRRVMATLEAYAWVESIDPGCGKPVAKWRVNPMARTLFSARAAEERVRREAARQEIQKAVEMARRKKAY